MDAAKRRVARTCRAQVIAGAPIESVWRVITDVTRTGEWSHECHHVTWLGGATALAPGARFRGRNRSAWLRWSRTCEVLTADPPHHIAWRTIPTPLFVDSTDWRITLEAAGAGTRIVQTFQVTRCPRWWEWIVARVNPRHIDRSAALTEDLQRIGAVAAADSRRNRWEQRPAPSRRRRHHHQPRLTEASPMTSAHTILTRWGNALGVWLYRRSDGRITGPSNGTIIGLLTVPGRNTGIPRTVAVGFFPHGTRYLVAGSGSGSGQDPQWFRNLRAASHAEIQIGATRMGADVRVAENAERDTLWHEVILAEDPRRRRYEKKAARVIPVAVLTPHQLRP
jgi:deazaflavin-dependent oxidoreductase (nitroreductase family)